MTTFVNPIPVHKPSKRTAKLSLLYILLTLSTRNQLFRQSVNQGQLHRTHTKASENAHLTPMDTEDEHTAPVLSPGLADELQETRQAQGSPRL